MTKQFILLKNQYTINTDWSWHHFGIGIGGFIEGVYKTIYIIIFWLVITLDQSSEVKSCGTL